MCQPTFTMRLATSWRRMGRWQSFVSRNYAAKDICIVDLRRGVSFRGGFPLCRLGRVQDLPPVDLRAMAQDADGEYRPRSDEVSGRDHSRLDQTGSAGQI